MFPKKDTGFCKMFFENYGARSVIPLLAHIIPLMRNDFKSERELKRLMKAFPCQPFVSIGEGR